MTTTSRRLSTERVSLRIRLATDPHAIPCMVIGWRLGLGPLLGRRLCLVTASADGEHLERRVLPYVFAGGDLFVPAVGNDVWAAAASHRPQVMAQAHPGPLSTRARLVTDEEHTRLKALLPSVAPDLATLSNEDWWVLQPTGDPAPPPVLPDLNWAWSMVAIATVATRRLVQRRGSAGS